MKPSGPWLLIIGRFLITVLFSVLMIGLVISSVSSWFSLGRLYLSKDLCISSRLSNVLAYSYLWKWKSLSRVQLFATPWTIVYEILQARIWEWVAVPSPVDLPNPGIEPRSPALQVDSLLSKPPGKPLTSVTSLIIKMFTVKTLRLTSSPIPLLEEARNGIR